MGFLSRLLTGSKKKAQEYDNNSDSYSKEINKCMSVLKISVSDYLLLARGYYKGHTSYRTLVDYALIDHDKILKLIREVGKKSKAGCVLDFTFVRFYYSPQSYIDLPFEVFANKKNMPASQLKTKLWHRANIKRILAERPKWNTGNDDELSEAIKEFTLRKNNIIAGE